MPGSQSRGRLFAISALILLLIAASWLPPVDERTERYVDDSLITALSAYGIARVINAGVSVAQSIETGVGVASIEPFQALDPVNDLAEDFASVMKLSIGALIVLKLMVEITSSLLFKVLFTGFGLTLAAFLLLGRALRVDAVAKAFLLFGFIRFSFMVIVMLVALISSTFIEDRTRENRRQLATFSELVDSYGSQNSPTRDEMSKLQQQRERLQQRQTSLIAHLETQTQSVKQAKRDMDAAREALDRIVGQLETTQQLNLFGTRDKRRSASSELEEKSSRYQEELGILENIQSSLKATKEDLDSVERALSGEASQQGWFSSLGSRLSAISDFVSIERLKNASEQAVTAMLNLMALFVFKTIILPIGFLYLLIRILNRAWGIETHRFTGIRGPETITETARTD